MSKESGSITLLKRAVELDAKKQWTSALICYKEGLQLLMDAIRTGSTFEEVFEIIVISIVD